MASNPANFVAVAFQKVEQVPYCISRRFDLFLRLRRRIEKTKHQAVRNWCEIIFVAVFLRTGFWPQHNQ